MNSKTIYQESELFKRYKNNPVLTPSMWKYRINSVFNAGATLYDGKVLLLVRIEDMKGFSHLCKAESRDGYTNWKIDDTPTLQPKPEEFPEEIYGIEDPRIIRLEDEGRYAIVYTSFSESGPLVSLATTEDFRGFRRYGVIMPPDDKDASLFPRKFNGRYVLIHRPSPTSYLLGAHIWISYSPDLKHWGDSAILLPARRGSWWDAYKVGLGPQPIETPEGWLIIYHGVKTTAAGSLYRLGLALLDLDDPSRIIKRCDEWVFGPNEYYERVGDVPDVTFPCGVVLKGDELIMYYGAADTTMAIATASLKDILEFLRKN
ncbi:MAG TPA: glycosidase [Ignavibacteria bacterium]|nr:glycosidase [Ignavibacteria bacterium]HMQ99129.1 glycosidase [Ignavibacteria bacterium]